jgi:hypothetical protein
MTFDEWLEQNKDQLKELLRGDAEQFAYECWLAGYKAGLDQMGSFATELFSHIR